MVKPREMTICGLAAVRARFQHHPASIRRLFFDLATGRRIGVMCSALAKSRKIYRCVEPDELEKVSGTLHHGGIVAIVEEPEMREPRKAEVAEWAGRREPLLLLDRIGNAHNLGAIARTAAFFGVRRIVLPRHPQAAVPGEAAYRVAEGGLEQVEIYSVPNLAAFIREAKAVYEVIGAAAHEGGGKKAAGAGQPVALVLGNEEHGLAPEVAAACSRLVTIRGSGAVESLNVSVAAAILIYQFFGKAKG